jgi:STE24 endopeptidase
MNEDRGARYHRLRRRAMLAATIGRAAWLVVLTMSGVGSTVFAWAASHGFVPAVLTGRVGTTLAFVAMAFFGYEAVAFPFTAYRSFVLDRRYGLSSETFRTWIGDHLKAIALALCITLVAAVAVTRAIDVAPGSWWVLSAAMFVGAGVLAAIVAPVALLPLFYRFNPLDRESLRERLLTLSEKAGISVLGAFEWGLGAKTTRANAALVGLGRTRRILVSDTLLRGYSDDEIEVILAHEIAHHVHRDVWSGLALESVVVTAGLLVAQLITHRWGRALGVSRLDDLAALPLIALILGAVSLAAAPLRNAWSRHTERRADRFALDLTRRPAAFISAMRRLGAQNLADARPSPAAFWLFHTHPTIDERIEAAKRFRAA